ncbi:MAG: hypothetical protein HYV07_01495 [Deltaproteobacteria bacterium]|nr:hypothetical protein [Deltaproteobacteria bacterium]
MKFWRRAVWVLGMTGALGCEDDPLIRLPEPEIHVDELKQKDAAQVDILWVIDNSGSMVDEQNKLAANFDRFITGLTLCSGGAADDICDFATKTCSKSGAPCNPPDYHIGVVSSDTLASVDQGKLRRVGLCAPSAGATPADGSYTYCLGDNRDCAAPNATCDMGQSISFITPTTPAAAAAFSRAVRVGIGGSGLERGIQAAAMALGRDADRTTGGFKPQPGENQGFVRPEASLFVIFVSDEEDSSFGQVPYFYRAFESLKGAGNEGLVSFSGIVGPPDADGPTGATEGGCISQDGQNAIAGTRYVSLAMYSRGLSAEFRVCDNLRLTCPEGSSCDVPVPGLPGACIPAGACQIDQDCGNFKCGDRGCITCENAKCSTSADRFLQLLTRNGVFAPICEDDYSQVLNALGFEAAGLQRKFQLTKNPDCSKSVPCPDDASTSPVCVKVSGQVIPNDRATGWVYEPTTNSVFFDGSFVPPTSAPVEISYRVSKTDRALSCSTALK